MAAGHRNWRRGALLGGDLVWEWATGGLATAARQWGQRGLPSRLCRSAAAAAAAAATDAGLLQAMAALDKMTPIFHCTPAHLRAAQFWPVRGAHCLRLIMICFALACAHLELVRGDHQPLQQQHGRAVGYEAVALHLTQPQSTVP